MKHFLVELTYTGTPEQVGAVRPAHRTFLQGGYEQGVLLCSGPQNPPTGAVVIARADSLEAIQTFFANDPYAQAQVARYRFVEFDPVFRQSFLEAWVTGA
ncbi:MAG: YciI family protein [Chloroflexaceae bacterium]|nr:YciI family protein [Chloroflexaceae bacterium]